MVARNSWLYTMLRVTEAGATKYKQIKVHRDYRDDLSVQVGLSRWPKVLPSLVFTIVGAQPQISPYTALALLRHHHHLHQGRRHHGAPLSLPSYSILHVFTISIERFHCSFSTGIMCRPYTVGSRQREQALDVKLLLLLSFVFASQWIWLGNMKDAGHKNLANGLSPLTHQWR